MEEVKSLGYKDQPPYEKLRCILQDGLKTIRDKDDGKLEFTLTNGAAPAAGQVRKCSHDSDRWMLDFTRSRGLGGSAHKSGYLLASKRQKSQFCQT